MNTCSSITLLTSYKKKNNIFVEFEDIIAPLRRMCLDPNHDPNFNQPKLSKVTFLS